MWNCLKEMSQYSKPDWLVEYFIACFLQQAVKMLLVLFAFPLTVKTQGCARFKTRTPRKISASYAGYNFLSPTKSLFRSW